MTLKDKPTVSRRVALRGLACATAAPALSTLPQAAKAATQGASPAILAAFAKYEAAKEALAKIEGDDTAFWGDVQEAEKALLATPVSTAEDAALKLEYAREAIFGDELGNGYGGLDGAMFEDVVDALRGRITLLPRTKPARQQATLTNIQRLYAKWQALTAQYKKHDAENCAGIIGNGRFEELTDPIFDARDELEAQVFAATCQGHADLHILIEIAAYHDWAIEAFNEGVARHSALIRMQERGTA